MSSSNRRCHRPFLWPPFLCGTSTLGGKRKPNSTATPLSLPPFLQLSDLRMHLRTAYTIHHPSSYDTLTHQ